MNKLNLSIENKLIHSTNMELSINGVDHHQWSIFFKEVFSHSKQSYFKKNVFVFQNTFEAESYFNEIKKSGHCYFFPGIGCDVYSSMLPSEFNLVKRMSTINSILNSPDEYSVICTIESLLLFVPPKEFFCDQGLSLKLSDIISPAELSTKLIELGFSNTPTVEEPGSYSMKGQIFDIYPLNSGPVRLTYFDDMIEEMCKIDTENLRSLKNHPLEEITLFGTQYSFLKKKNLTHFRSQFPRPLLSDKEKFNYREQIFKKLNSHSFFDDYPLFISYFFPIKHTLRDYVSDAQFYFFNNENCRTEFLDMCTVLPESFELYHQDSDDIKPKPENIYDFNFQFPKNSTYINHIDISVDFEEKLINRLDLKIFPIENFGKLDQSKTRSTKLIDAIKHYYKKRAQIRIYYTSTSSKAEMEYLVFNFAPETKEAISFHHMSLNNGFYYETENILFLSESDFFSVKTKKTTNRNTNIDKDVFAEQISTLQINDHVIHKDFGIGVYLGIETLDLAGSISDFLVIKYQDNDKVYVPVYKINLVQKHSSSESKVTLSNLKTKKFDAAKAKAKTAVKKLAFDLLELQAKREIQQGFSFSEPDHNFNSFSLSFKFNETPDQISAINDVISDMISVRPMDRLVCGDVGFGKTEVAMRAAYKAVLDNKQVCILVPTTVLALQHFSSFTERFKNTAVNVDYISRFKTPKQEKETIELLADGKIDILIGTHKILSPKVQFKDIGLLVIDEEQRFGVGHKEKLKLLRENVDTLTLTATPIPRTLQLSFLGIKDLSVIKTPPAKRQSIKTYIIKEDLSTLKLAINKELKRGGQVFIIHNKVIDIEIYTSKIRELVPEARIIYAHGQLAERDLEKRISDFYNYKYDILIATTIIESGIDIPRANTMIIDRADTYGLSQLHQLRGRIGRSDKKAYAYFVVPGHKKLSEIASKRLRALQTYADLGSGYALATSDLEIRGSGDILGPEQSGHIGSIGLELYMELLKESINEIKGLSREIKRDVEIQTQFSAFIPKEFIENSGIRLRFYKKLSNATSESELMHIVESIIDQFGKIPLETENLISIIKSRLYLSSIGIVFVKTSSFSIHLKFSKDIIEENEELRNKIINLFTQRPKIYKINPDYSINCKFKDKVFISTLLEFSNYLYEQLI